MPYEVGADVYVARSGSWDTTFTAAKVVRVTPSGQVDVQIGSSEPVRFNTDGSERGETSRVFRRYLDKIPFSMRTEELERRNRAVAAANILRHVVPGQGLNERWGKEGLGKEVERLQALLDEARKAVEAI